MSGPEDVPLLCVRRAGVRGPLIVLLHGLASSSHYWGPGVPLLASEYRLLLPDLLGFGRSPKPRASLYGPEEHVAALFATLKATLPAGERFVLVGHSAGSLIALRYATEYPDDVAALVLLALPAIGCIPYGHREDGSLLPFHRFMAHGRIGSAVATGLLRAFGPLGRLLAPRVQRDAPPAAARDALSVTSASYWRTLENVVYSADIPAMLDRLRLPLQLIHGDGDRIAPVAAVRELAASFPGLPLRIIGEAGHNPWFTHTEETVAILRAFIRSVVPDGAYRAQPAEVAAQP